MGKITPRFFLAVFIFGLCLLSANTVLANINYGPEKPMSEKEVKEISYFVGFLLEDAPTIIAPEDKTENNDPGECYASSLNLGTATIEGTNNSPELSVNGNNIDPSNYEFQVGVTTVTWTITNDDGTDSDTQTITINDNTKPTASNLAPVSVQCKADIPATDISVLTDEADNCTSNPTVAFVSDSSNGNSNPEIITRTYSVTDEAGNSINVTQEITVDDTTNPTASNPAPVSVQCSADIPTADIAVVTDEADNCTSNPTVAFVSDSSDGNSNPEVITRTFSVTDETGNSINVFQEITVDDTTNPTASNPAPVSVQCSVDIPTADIAVVTDEADNCTSNPTVAFVSDSSDGNSNPEIITRTYSVTDEAGNSINVTQEITVDDTIDPTASNPAPISVQCSADIPAADTTVVTDEADNCTANPIVAYVSDSSDGNSNPEVITRTYSVTDEAGNSINVFQEITVDDTTNPTASNPAPVSVQCSADIPTADIAVVTDEADNCTSNPTVAFVSDSSNGNSNPEIITRTFSVTDETGNSINVFQEITVDDTTNPTANNPAPVSVQCSADIPTADIAVVTDEADNCTSNPTVAFVSDSSDGNSNPEVITRTYSVTDDAGNSINVFQEITVDDTTNPTANNPAPVSVQCSADIPTADIAVVTDKADNCTANLTVAFVSDSSNGNSNPEVITRTYSVTDEAGNTIEVIQEITVTDTTDPTASNPAPVSVQCSADIPAADIAVVTDEADNCTSNPTVAFVSDVSDGNSNPEVITRTYSVTDDAGNAIEVSQEITVNDTTDPTASNPAPISVQCSADIPAADIAVVTDEADNCTSNPTVAFISDVSDGNSNPEVIKRTYSVTDDAGNAIEVSQEITVNDTTDPTASNPAPISVKCSADIPAADTTVVTDEADNCTANPIVAYVSDSSDGNSNPEVITRTYSITDEAGNSINVNQTITVDDTTDPTASNPESINVQCEADVPNPDTSVVTDAEDNCTANLKVKFVSDLSDGNFNPEVITRTYSVTDEAGNAIEITQEITIQDTQFPETPVLPDLTAECSLTVVPPTTTDNCDGEITGTTGLTDLTFDIIGEETIYWIFTDASGKSTEAAQKITITDNAPEPDITGTLPPQTFNGCQISSISEFTRPTATDQCDGLILGTLAEDFLFPYSVIGSNIIEWEFVDSHGNISLKTQEIRLTPENIDGGDLKGYLTTDGASTSSEEVDITACASGSNQIQMKLSNEIGTIVRWEKYEVGTGFWEVINNSSDSYSVTFDASTSESTLFRVLIQKGTCNEYSNNFYARAIPPDTAPILDQNLFNICLTEPVSLVARNGLIVQEDALTGKGGDFQRGQFPDKHNPDMWRIDGAAASSHFTASANNGKPNNWAGTNPNEIGSITYNSGDPKFGIAQGDYSSSWIKKKQPQVYRGESTLETPIFSLKNIGTASLEFDQAYNLVNSDYATLELSLDGGNTYSITLQSLSGGDTWDYSNPAKATTPPSSSTNYNFENDNSTFDLTPYVGNSEVRIRWTFHGTSDASAWAIDGISIPTEPLLDEIEWTDGLGNPDKPVLSNGRLETTYTFTPEAPGYHEYGATILVDGCRAYDPEGTALAKVYVSYSYAGEDIIYTTEECGQNVVQLNAYDNSLTAAENITKKAFDPLNPYSSSDDPGTGEIGKWTYVTSTNSCENGLFSSSNPTKYPDPTNDPNATFTAGAGTYILTWTVNGCSDDLTITITECDEINFDGKDDYIDFDDNYDLNGAFSFEIWIKPESTTGTQTIFSKRDLNNMATGYDLKLVGDKISFNWNTSGRIASSYPITSSRWYHIAVTHTGSLYNLYIDGILIKSVGGGSPNINDTKAILGAMYSNLNDAPSNYFNGWMEEIRIWNTALKEAQLHLMMNQRIKEVNTNEVEGEEIPVIVNNLSWTNLIGYYRMDNIGCGNLIPYADIGVTGKLKNITSPQDRSAPLPYIATKGGNWWDTNTWKEPLVWDPPSSAGITGDTIAWNIVRLNNKLVHNPASTNNSKSIDLLALLDEGGTLDMQGANNTSGNGLTISRYFKLDGVLDLNGESQLIQSEGSEVLGSGYLTRDQQGTASSYNYNYWSSPVVSNTGNQSYTIASVMHDGTDKEVPKKLDIGPTGYVTYADGGLTVPRRISGRWLYKFRGDANQYSEWEYVGKDGTLLAGEGYTMKGTSGQADIKDLQNYTFRGFPNNGPISLSVAKDQNYLLGNPYPSAIEAKKFILDNLSKHDVNGATNTSNIFNGALYFWDHFGGETHILREYVGGYATINLSGAVQSASSVDERINNNNAPGTKTPGSFIPVGQGFFVNTVLDQSLADDLTISGGNINFNNGQRAFASEAIANDSQFLKPIDLTKGPKTVKTKDSRYKIRLNFTSPLGYQRQILVTADAYTTNGFDLGYDALSNDNIPEDMFWLIKENKFVIQGVPHFNLDQILPLGITIAEEKEFSIEIGELENVPDIIDIYLRDNSDSTYYDLRKEAFKASLPAGEYQDLYEIVFHDVTSTRKDKEPSEGPIDYYYSLDNREFVISNPELHKIEHINIYNIAGQLVDQHFGIPDLKEIHVPQKKSLSSAVYIVKVYTDAGDYAKKVIIRKD